MLPYALLGLLASQPRHGYDLKNAIEHAFGGHREINFGQIYTTLSRLERDGLVSLLIEGAMLHLQADLRWLDICDERLERLEKLS
jgi:DNA-binding PadR family transcriptional regulator